MSELLRSRLSASLCSAIAAMAFSALLSMTSPSHAQDEPLAKLHDQLRQEQATALAKDAREKGDPIRGAILFAQRKLGCAGCHRQGANDLLGPDLTRLTKTPTDLQVVLSLLDPSAVIAEPFQTINFQLNNGKRVSGRVLAEDGESITLRDDSPKRKIVRLAKANIEAMKKNEKSAMPDGLGNLLRDRREFLDLAHYAMTLVAIGESEPSVTSVAHRELPTEIRGLALMETLRCRACHQRPKSPIARLGNRGPDLRWSAQHVSAAYLREFIRDPQAVKPGARMPNVLTGITPDDRDTAVHALLHFVLSLRESDITEQARDEKSAERGRDIFHSVGCVACHLPRDEQAVEIKPEPDLQFVALGGVSKKHHLAGLVEFLENPHKARPAGLMPNLQLTHWEAVDVANYLMSQEVPDRRHAPDAAGTAPRLEREAIAVDAALALQGKTLFGQLGCAECHALDSQPSPRTYPALTPTSKGCLSGRDGDHPVYELSRQQREDLQAAIRVEKLPPQQQAEATMAGLRCYACHHRDGLGGIEPSLDEYFQTENPNLGPQGRIPPTLTGVGAKLNPKWMRQVLVGGRSIRPYVKTRMPKFGAENVEHLVDLLGKVDQQPPAKHATFTDQKEMRTVGHQLMGAAGLNCVACHTYQQKPAGVMPGVDVTEMAERLQKDWFYRYMKAPQRLSPNTVMPSFWPGGRAIRQDVLGGDPEMQIEALWQYLLDGRQARQPRGVVVEPMELVATDEAVMLRRSYPGVGKRGIGVGYPSEVNMVFDAEQMRLAMLWQGKFADPAGVWRSQGHGSVRPLSREVIRMPAGPDLDDNKHPWVVDDGRPPEHHFRGYRLDKLRRPTWMYQFRDVLVKDYFVDQKVTADDGKLAFFERRVTLQTKGGQSGLRFRVAGGKKIESTEDGGFAIDDRLYVDAEKSLKTLDEAGGGSSLIWTFDLEPGMPTELIVRYRWKQP